MIELILVETEEQKSIAKEIVETYHSYVPHYKSVGRRIDYLIKLDEEIIGMIGIGSSTYPPCKDILHYLNITKNQYKESFNEFANNWRYCFKKRVYNAGTQVLKLMRNRVKIDWLKKYGDNLKYLITFVGANHDGGVYKADNWTLVGQTAGLPKHNSSSMKWNTNKELKKLFVKPTGENKKLIFIKKLK